MNVSDRIREHAEQHYVSPARSNRQGKIEIRAGTVARALGLTDRTPQVCSALRSRKFLDRNGLRLVNQEGPPSGMSTSVTFRYEFVDASADAAAMPLTRGVGGKPSQPTSRPGGQSVFQKLRDMRGLAREMYGRLGGPEKALDDERAGFSR